MDRRLVRTALSILVAVLLGACDATTSPTPSPGGTAPETAPGTLATPSTTSPRSVTVSPTPPATIASRSPGPTASPSPIPSAPSGAPALVGPAPCPGRTPGTPSGPGRSESSTNWSGYTAMSTRSIFTCVEATWIQPTIRCSGTATRALSIWVGIGGFDQTGLEQIGTEADCRRGTASASLWHESLPAQKSEVRIDLAVRAGDTVRARVLALGKSVYELSIVNVTRNTTFSVRDTNRRVRTTSAEWIVEAPTGGCPSNCRILSMPNFGKVRMSGTWLTASGVRSSITGGGYTHVNDRMVTSGGQTTRAVVTSTATDGSSFAVTWRHS